MLLMLILVYQLTICQKLRHSSNNDCSNPINLNFHQLNSELVGLYFQDGVARLYLRTAVSDWVHIQVMRMCQPSSKQDQNCTVLSYCDSTVTLALTNSAVMFLCTSFLDNLNFDIEVSSLQTMSLGIACWQFFYRG